MTTIACKECDTTKEVQPFTEPTKELNVIRLCWSCAAEQGFCPMCGHFVLGTGYINDSTLSNLGICEQCARDIDEEQQEALEKYE